MDLRKQIQVTLNNDTVNSNRVDKLETICDDFAIGFAEWVDNKTVQISKGEWANWQEDAKSCLTSKELIQIYKDIQK